MPDRRSFIKEMSVASAAMAISSSSFARTFAPVDEKIKVGVIGTGLRGQSHVKLLSDRKDTEIVTICDIDERMLTSTKNIFSKAGKTQPKVYTGDKYAYQALCT
jgi:ornithine cyclodeaminase/alanine dehydrogenase-like protein (mu-crystallin family)